MTLTLFLKPCYYPIQGTPLVAGLGKKLGKRIKRWKMKMFPGLSGIADPERVELARQQEEKAFEAHVKETTRRYEDEDIALIAMLEGLDDEQ